MAERFKKLIIQIPCYNEAETLGITLDALPRTLPGVETVEWLIIDDGSTDNTVEVAQQHGVDHVVRQPQNRGLARAFVAGLEACIEHGADIIVNTDADNQYNSDDIPTLIQPILEDKAEFVVGERPIKKTAHFSPLKKLLQALGSWSVRLASHTEIPDAPSGFRAMTRRAAMQLNVFNEYTYTLETLIQAGQKGMAVASVPIRTNPPLRPSRLMRSMTHYMRRSALTIIRIFMTYRSFFFFLAPGCVSLSAGLALGGRFVYHYLADGGAGMIQSLILAALLIGGGGFLIVIGFLADLISVNRQLLEKANVRLQILEDRLRDRDATE